MSRLTRAPGAMCRNSSGSLCSAPNLHTLETVLLPPSRLKQERRLGAVGCASHCTGTNIGPACACARANASLQPSGPGSSILGRVCGLWVSMGVLHRTSGPRFRYAALSKPAFRRLERGLLLILRASTLPSRALPQPEPPPQPWPPSGVHFHRSDPPFGRSCASLLPLPWALCAGLVREAAPAADAAARAAGRGGKSRLNGRIVGGGGGGGFAARVAGGGRTRASSGLSDGCRKQAAEQQQKQEERRSTVWTITVHWRLAGGGGRCGVS